MSALTRLHLIRHGRVDEAWQDRIYGDMDVPLSPVGEAEARRVADRLAGIQLAAVVSSGLARAEFGAAQLRGDRGLPRRDEPDLREINRGAWRGLTFDELEAREPGAMARWRADPAARPPEGESLEDVAARVLPRIEALAGEFAGAEVAVVSHSWVTRLVASAALGFGAAGTIRLDLATGGLVVVDWPADPRAVASGGLRPTMVGFSIDAPPERGVRWFRGPHRG